MPGGFKIGTLSRRTGLSTATLRLWEEQYGLLTPKRTPGRQRIYTEGDVERVLYVRHLISNRGYSLQGVASILDEARHNLPPLAQGLLDVDEEGPQSQRLGQLATDLRAYLEDTQLRLATNKDQIREGEVLSEIHTVMRSVARASTFAEATTALILGSAGLIGNQPVTLAVYQPDGDLLRMVITGVSGRILAGEGEPFPVAALAPAALRTAFREGHPYYVRQTPYDELTPEARRRAVASGVQSLYAHPLVAGSEVVGLLLVTSRRVDGVSPEVQAICARVAGIVGPAVAYFAARDQRPAA